MAKLATFLVMLAFWVILSGMFDPFHFTLGLLCCALVAYFSHDLLFFGGNFNSWVRGTLGIIGYLPVLFWEIVKANIQVIYVVLHPRMMELIDPQVVRFRTTLKKPISKVALAQSITLTPGTITVDIQGDEFIVYARTREAAEGCPGAMEERLARALEEVEA